MKNGLPNPRQPGMVPHHGPTMGSVPSPAMQQVHGPPRPPMMIPNTGPGTPISGPVPGSQQMPVGPPGAMHHPSSLPPMLSQQNSQQQSHQIPLQQQTNQPTSQPTMHLNTFPKQHLCRLGADLVQEIVSKTLELFQHLRLMTPHFANPNQQLEDKKNKIKDSIKLIENQFNKLRKIYDFICANETNQNSSASNYTDPKLFLKFKDDDDEEENGHSEDEKMLEDKNHESSQKESSPTSANKMIQIGPIQVTEEKYKSSPKLIQLEKEYNDLVELNRLKNRQLKEIIDTIRKLVWDINAMLSMRRP